MKRIFWTSLVLLLFWSAGCNNIDSNRSAIDPTKERDSISLWIKWATDSTQLSKNQKTDFLNRAFSHLKNNQEDQLQIENLIKLSFAYLVLNDSTNFKKANTYLMQMAIQKNDHKARGMAHWDLADFHKSKKPDKNSKH